MNPLSFGDTLSPSPGGLSVHYGRAVLGVSPPLFHVLMLWVLWVFCNTLLQRKVRHDCGQRTFIDSNCWFVAQKWFQIRIWNSFWNAENTEEKLFFMMLHLMCICFGSPSVTWLWLGSMWYLWPFLTLAEGCCDQLRGRLSVSHWGLVFKWWGLEMVPGLFHTICPKVS